MIFDDFIKFLSENWIVFEKLELSEPLLLFFIFKNLYYSVIPQLNEFSIVDDFTFNSVVDDFTEHNSTFKDDNFYTSCILFSKYNYLLTDSQKNLLKTLLSSDGKKEESESYFKQFRIFYSKDSEGRHYLLFSESHLYNIVKSLTSILENEKPNFDLNNKIVIDKCKEYLNNYGTKSPLFDSDSLLEDEFLSPVNYNLIKLSICFFLLHVNPSFSGVSKRLLKLLTKISLKIGRKTLFNSILIVNNLIILHPKESDLWEVKTLLAHLWFSKYDLRMKRVVLLPNGSFGIKRLPMNIYYSYLMKTVYRLFKDKLLLLDQSFIPEILSITPFNNCIVSYLNYQYQCVVKFVISLFMRKIKGFCVKNFNNSNNSSKFISSNRYNKFEEFNYLTTETRYNIALCNSIFKLFYDFYKRLLRRYSFLSLFILLVNLLKVRDYNKVQLSCINDRHLYQSCFLYTRLDEDFEDCLDLCDEMIKKDSENCWVDNKSKLMYHILDLDSLLKPFYSNDNLVDLVFKFKTVLIFNQHFSTWSNVFNTSKIYNTCTSLYVDKSRVKLKKRMKFNRKTKEEMENKRDKETENKVNKSHKVENKENRNVKLPILLNNIDEYKSESVLIRKLVNQNFNRKIKEQMENNERNNEYGFQNVRYIYLESYEILKKFNDFQIDHILNSFNQLLYLLFHLFRNISHLKRNPRFKLDLFNFKLLFQTLRKVFKYSKIVEGLGTKNNVLVGIKSIKRMTKDSRLIMYKYYKMLNIGDVPYYLEFSLAKICLLLLSAPFRFYLHWNVSSQSKLELVCKHFSPKIKTNSLTK